MNSELYTKLVDMYAGGELPEELESEMRKAALTDTELAVDMRSMRETVEGLHAIPKPEFTEESYQRILMRVYARGVEFSPKAPTPSHLQYHLPIQG